MDMYLKESRYSYNRNTCMSLFIAAVFTISMIRSQLRSTTNHDRIKKM
jgi:hypothetical protein